MFAEILRLYSFPSQAILSCTRWGRSSVSLFGVFAFCAVTRICYFCAAPHRRTAVFGRAMELSLLWPRKRLNMRTDSWGSYIGRLSQEREWCKHHYGGQKGDRDELKNILCLKRVEMRWRGVWQGALWVDVWWAADLVSPDVFILLHPSSLRLVHSLGGQWAREEPSFKERLESIFWQKFMSFLIT